MKEKINIAEILSIDDLPNEIWKDIPEYKGFYQVSNLGRVKSLKRYWIKIVRKEDNYDRR